MIRWIQSLKPLQALIYGYLAILISGFLLLCLPIFHTCPVNAIDNLFTATSAISTTGLATISIAEHYNIGGEIVLLILVQIGGLGYMSIGSFIVLMQRKRLSLNNSELVRYDFSLPDKFNVRIFIRDLIITAVSIEIIGSILLAIIFRQAGEVDYIWKGIFHSISAFCTAGFSLFPDSLEAYSGSFALNAVVGVLSISGALGFIVFTDIFEKISGKKESITFTSRIIIRFTFAGILLGGFIIFLSDPGIAAFTPEKRILVAFFQSIAAFTTVGFNTYPIAAITHAPLFIVLLLMVIGASPSGTGGGMKSTTVTALFAQLQSTFKGKTDVTYLNKRIPEHRVRMATSNFFFYVIIICTGTYLLLLVQPQDTFNVFFEAVSALGTVGLSAGVTSELTNIGKIIIMLMMFLGRIGPLTFGMVLFGAADDEDAAIEEEDLAI